MVCHPDLEELLQAWPAELPDEFFQVTVDDVRRRLAQLQSERWVCPGPFGSRTPMPLAAPRWVWGPRHGVPRQALYGGAASRTWGGAREKSRVQLVWGLCSGWGHRHLHHPSPCRKRLEEAPLVTKAFREAQMKEKLERYPKVHRGPGGCLHVALSWGLLWLPQGTRHWLWSPGLHLRPAQPQFVDEPVNPIP